MNQETKVTLKQIHTHKRKLNISYRKPLKNIDNNPHKKIQFHKKEKKEEQNESIAIMALILEKEN
jgi:hypothetical protein